MYWVRRGVPGREDEPVAAEPRRVGRVVPHHALVQQVGQRRQADRRAGMSVAHLLDGVGGQHAHGVDGAAIEVGPLERGVHVRSFPARPWRAGCARRSSRRGARVVGGDRCEPSPEHAGPRRACPRPSVWCDARRRRCARRAGGRRTMVPAPAGRGPGTRTRQRRSLLNVRSVTTDASVVVDGAPIRPARAGAPASDPRRVRRPDQASDHRAAAGHHCADDGPRGATGCRRSAWSWRRWWAAPQRPGRRTRSTACWTATSTA